MNLRTLLLFAAIVSSATATRGQTPEAPYRFVGSCGERIEARVTSGTITYFAQGPNVRIVDTSRPDAAQQIAVLTFETGVTDIKLCGPPLFIRVLRAVSFGEGLRPRDNWERS